MDVKALRNWKDSGLKCKAYVLISLILTFFVLSGSPVALDRPQPVYSAVWHQSQTVGILKFQGRHQQLIYCDLIIIEEVEKEHKANVLAELALKYPVREVDFKTMLDIVGVCNDLQRGRQPPFKIHSMRPALRNQTRPLSLWTMLKGIVPGTKWCGVNDIANNYHDLGEDFDLDKCCRAHDHCPIKVKSFSQNFGVRNNHPYTKSHCDCDDLFFKCLKDSGNEKAQSIGNVFFNVLGLQCVEPTFEKVCLSYEMEGGGYSSNSGQVQKRLLLDIFGSRGGQAKPKCLNWVENRDGPVKFRFRSPRKQYQ